MSNDESKDRTDWVACLIFIICLGAMIFIGFKMYAACSHLFNSAERQLIDQPVSPDWNQ